MNAAVTIAVLFLVSVLISRIASVAIRLTGVPDPVARLQCVSALTGTGFTTGESEMIVNYPFRRKVLMGLMVTGNLGLVSVAATFVVTFIDVGTDATAIARQIGAIVLALGVAILLIASETIDRAMCSTISWFLARTTSLGERDSHRLLDLDGSYSVAEHRVTGTGAIDLAYLGLAERGLVPLAVRAVEQGTFRQVDAPLKLRPGDWLIAYGPDDAHDVLERELAKRAVRQGA